MISNDKILGVFVDENLTWSYHIGHLSKKITSSIWYLSKVKKILSQEHHFLFHKSYIQTHIDFVILFGLAPLNRISKKFLGYRKEHVK